MTFAATYSRALRYALAPKEGIASFAEQSEANGPTDPNNHSDHIFADFLADHDDPRHEIVRRDLHLRSLPDSNMGFHGQLQNDRNSRFGEGNVTGEEVNVEQPDGWLDLLPLHHPKTEEIVGHRVTWHPKVASGHGSGQPYFAHFDAAEFDDLMQKLELPHSTDSAWRRHLKHQEDAVAADRRLW